MSENSASQSDLTLQNRKMLSLSGVKKLDSINENQAKLQLSDCSLFIFGKELRTKKLNIEDGQIVIEGIIDAIKYGQQKDKTPFFKRLFK